MEDPKSAHAFEPEPPASESLEELVRQRAARKKRALAGVAIGVVGLGAGLFGLLRYQAVEADRAVSKAWTAFSGCVIGGAPSDDEPASLRFRRLQLAAMAMTDAERIGEGSDRPWPSSCTPLGHATAEALATAGEKDGPLATGAEALGKQLADAKGTSADLSASIDAVFGAARALGIALDPEAKAPKAPPEPHPLTTTFLRKGTPLSPTAFSLAEAFTDLHPGKVMRLLIDDRTVPGAPLVCTFSATAAEATCKTLPPSVAKKSGLRLLGTADDGAEPLVFAGNRGADGVFRADTGELVDSFYSYGGYARKDGASAVLGWDEQHRKPLLSRKAKGGAPDRMLIDTNLRVSNFYYDTQLLWDLVLIRGMTERDERRFFASPYPWHGAALPFVDVGELEEPGLIEGGEHEPPHITGCRTGQTTAVRVKGRYNDFLSFYSGGKWSPPVSPELTGGTLSCHGAEAAVTRVEPGAADAGWRTTVAHVRCTAAGCNGVRVKLEDFVKLHYELGPKGLHVDAADLDGQLLVVWAAGERGGVRMRLGPPDRIGASPDIVLFDDWVDQGEMQKLPGLFDLRVFSREGFAVVVLSTVGGVYALRVDPGGKVTPVHVGG